MSKAVKYYSSDDIGAPKLLQTGWGHMVNLYRTLCAGYNLQTAESILYDIDTKLVTINFSIVPHNYRVYQTIKIDFVGSQYHNKEFLILSSNTNSIICKTKEIFTDDLVSGDIKTIVSPLGMIHEYTDGVGKSAFKFAPEEGEDPTYLVINDTQPTEFTWNNNSMCATPAVYMCKNLTGIDGTAEDIVPFDSKYPNAYKGGAWKDSVLRNYWNYGIMNILYQGNWSGSAYTVNNSAILNQEVKWIMIGNEDYHLLYIWPNNYNIMMSDPILYTFGRYNRKNNADKYNYIFNAAYNYIQNKNDNCHFYQFYSNIQSSGVNGWSSIIGTATNNIFSSYRITYNKNTNTIRTGTSFNSYAQTEVIGLKGATVNYNIDLSIRPRKLNTTTFSGEGGESWPPYDGQIKLSRMDIYECTSAIERGILKGVYWIHHLNPFSERSVVKITDENNRLFYAICMVNAASTAATAVSYSGSNSQYYSRVLISLDEDDWNE